MFISSSKPSDLRLFPNPHYQKGMVLKLASTLPKLHFRRQFVLEKWGQHMDRARPLKFDFHQIRFL